MKFGLNCTRFSVQPFATVMLAPASAYEVTPLTESDPFHEAIGSPPWFADASLHGVYGRTTCGPPVVVSTDALRVIWLAPRYRAVTRRLLAVTEPFAATTWTMDPTWKWYASPAPSVWVAELAPAEMLPTPRMRTMFEAIPENWTVGSSPGV